MSMNVYWHRIITKHRKEQATQAAMAAIQSLQDRLDNTDLNSLLATAASTVPVGATMGSWTTVRELVASQDAAHRGARDRVTLLQTHDELVIIPPRPMTPTFMEQMEARLKALQELSTQPAGPLKDFSLYLIDDAFK